MTKMDNRPRQRELATRRDASGARDARPATRARTMDARNIVDRPRRRGPADASRSWRHFECHGPIRRQLALTRACSRRKDRDSRVYERDL